MLRLIAKYKVPPWQPPMNSTPGTAAWKRSLRTFRRTVLVPALQSKRASVSAPAAALPWGWLAAQGGATFNRSSFDLWLHIRIVHAALHTDMGAAGRGPCKLCTAPLTGSLRSHLELDCPVISLRAGVEGWSPRRMFDPPSDPATFCSILAALDGYAAACASP